MASLFITPEQFKAAARGNNTPQETALRKEFIAELKEGDADKRELLFTISTSSVDRQGDKISPDGWELDNYRKNPVVLWAHDYASLPIARANKVWIEDGKLKALTEFVDAKDSQFADRVYKLYKKGFLSATSVGFMPKKWAWTEDKDRKFGIDFEKQELLEFSAVPVPANAEALIEARAAGIDLAPIRDWAKALLADQEIKSIRELESFLRDAGGFSRKDAALLASHGWKGLSQREADDLQPFEEVIQQFRKTF